jgi:hypothetical protein
MSWLHHEVSWAGNRSVHELLITGAGVTLCTVELTSRGGPDVGNAIVYISATLLFALRFYLARAIGVGACIAAIAQQWPNLRYGLDHADVMTLGVLPLLGIIALASPHLTARFEGAPSNISLLPNPWSSFSTAQTRTLRWSCYAAGALAGLLDHSVQISHLADPPLWPQAAMVAIIISIGALSLGRSVGLLSLWITGLTVAFLTAPQVFAAEAAIAGDIAGAHALIFTGGPHYILPIILLALASSVIATPFTARLLRRTIAG